MEGKTGAELASKYVRRSCETAGGIKWAIDVVDKLIAERFPRQTVVPHAFRLHLIKEMRAAYWVGHRDGKAE